MRKKVLILMSRLGGGGAERVAADLSRVLAQRHEVAVITFNGGDSYEHGGKRIDLGLPFSPTPNLFEKVRRLFEKTRHLREVGRREQPDVVVSFSDSVNIIALLTHFTGMRAKCIVSTQIPPSKVYKGAYRFLYGAMIRFFYRQADSVVALSEGVKEDLVQSFRVPATSIHVIHNGVDCEAAQARGREIVADDLFKSDLPVILNIGRLMPQKNQALLIRAFAQVRRTLPSRLAIVGAGKLEPDLRALVAELELQEDVCFLGWQNNPFQYLSRASLFVLSSDFEGFGNVLVEAMACGCPVISTDCPWGPAEILNSPDYGRLVPVGNEEQLAREMLNVLCNEELRRSLAEAGQRRAKDFDISVMSARYEKLFTPVQVDVPTAV